MKCYKNKFKGYLEGLAARQPAPGGGSAVCLVFCFGVSLIEKAVNYSIKDKQLRKSLSGLSALKKKVYPYIDEDGFIFKKIMLEKGEKRRELLKKSNRIMRDTKKACQRVFLLAKEVKSGIKKSIISDFEIGLDFVKSAVKGCEANLKANKAFFVKQK